MLSYQSVHSRIWCSLLNLTKQGAMDTTASRRMHSIYFLSEFTGPNLERESSSGQ